MMKKLALSFLCIIISLVSYGQWVESPTGHCENPEFNRKVNRLLNYSVDVIDVSDLNGHLEEFTLLDIRELDEYLVSHLPGASHFGYDQPKWDILDTIDKDQPIVVYCSIGYRSEKIGEKLMKKGFTNVRNLYGSIFEWANQNYPMVDKDGNATNSVHGYNKRWSKWVTNDAIDVEY